MAATTHLSLTIARPAPIHAIRSGPGESGRPSTRKGGWLVGCVRVLVELGLRVLQRPATAERLSRLGIAL